eukprot:98525-Rhodomonas_salina.1
MERAPVFVRIKPLGRGKTGTSEKRGSLVQHTFKPMRTKPLPASELRKQYEGEQREAEAALARGCVGKDPRSYADIRTYGRRR